jgi:hypothetical protein
VGERKELIAVRENIVVGVVSVLVGLVVGFLAWGASASWSAAPPAMMNGMGGPMMGPSMMGQGMMNQAGSAHNHDMMGSEHMAQCHQMMGSMMSMMQQMQPSK